MFLVDIPNNLLDLRFLYIPIQCFVVKFDYYVLLLQYSLAYNEVLLLQYCLS